MKKSLCVRISRLVCVFAVVLAVVSLSACSKSSSKKLYLFNWTYYTPDEVIKQFEKEFGVSVKVDSYASNEEMYAKLMAGATGYDIIFPSQDYVSILIKQGKLAEIDHSKFPNKDNISDLVLAKASYDPEMKYSVPYYMGAAGIAVNKDRVKNYEKSWDIFSRTDLKDRMCMMDDMREVIGDALVSKGYSVNSLNSAELAEAKKLILTEWKPNLTKFDAEGFGKSFASGDFYVVQGYAEAVFGEVPEEKWNTVDFFIPEEGGPMYIDSLCILKNSKNYDLAMEFINFIHRPEIYAQFLDAFHFPAGVNTKAAAYMTTEPHYSAEDMKNCEIKNDLAEGIDVYNAIWQEIRFEN
ncbi:MAG: extracellular solute-binding protein [Treponemataceae bacterium]|nr:extracellular solute-binding protein [Treponemataceae bacterium]